MSQSVNEHLNQTRNDLVKEISLNKADFNFRPNKDQWSIAQVCHHLVLVEEASVKAIMWGLKESTSKNIERKDVHLILNRKNKIQAPKMVEPSEEAFDIRKIMDLLSDSREKLTSLLNSLENKSILKGKSVKHPAFGELPLDQWVELIYLHEQRHIEQIKEIKLHFQTGL